MSVPSTAIARIAPAAGHGDTRRRSRVLRAVGVALGVALEVAITVPALADDATTQPASPAHVLAVGDALPAMPQRDQHDAEVRIDASTRIVLFTRDMDGGGFVKEALAEDGSAMLASAHAVYLSDVSRMPSFVRSAFALPSLRRRTYPVVLDETGTGTAELPYSEGKATILSLDSGRITAVTFAASAAEVRAALGK